jgi:hypothetical protein
MRAAISGGNAIWLPGMIVPSNSIALTRGSRLHDGTPWDIADLFGANC